MCLVQRQLAEAVLEDLGLVEDLDVMNKLVAVKDRDIVDAGCGAGALARAMAEAGARVVALEPDPTQADANRRELSTHGIAFHETGAQAMPCRDHSMDGVVFSNSLHHVSECLMDRALEEARRVLKPDGFLYVLEPEPFGTHTELMLPFHDETAARLAAKSALKKTEHWFENVRIVRFHNRRRYDDFKSFVDQVSGYGFNDYRREDVGTETVTALFAKGRHEDGFWFEQPMRVHLLERLVPN